MYTMHVQPRRPDELALRTLTWGFDCRMAGLPKKMGVSSPEAGAASLNRESSKVPSGCNPGAVDASYAR
jgi:hypothetical protein